MELPRFLQWTDRFVYERDVTPLSGWFAPWVTVTCYFVGLRILQWRMKDRKAMEFPRLLFLHNIVLSAASSVVFAFMAYILWMKHSIRGYGLREMICGVQMHEEGGSLKLAYYINYWFKYYELLDTILLVLRKKPVMFLHEYHHAATLVLTWSQLREHSTVQWMPIGINLFVHIVMYYYYAVSAVGIRVWWKKYLTTLQILQFVVDVVACSYAYAIFIANGMSYAACYGTQVGAVTGILILTSYLILFIQFYFRTYGKAPKRGAKQD